MINVGSYTIREIIFSNFGLDGGAMFGVVPKSIWEKLLAPDTHNRIPLTCRSILIEGGGRKILVDTGMRGFGDNKFRERFNISDSPEILSDDFYESITDLVLTHLHFDHAASLAKYNESGAVLGLRYPNAKIHLQRANYQEASFPSLREKASYLKPYIELLKTSDLHLIDGASEIFEGLFVNPINGHTSGQQWIEIRDTAQPLFYLADLVPTSHHISIPYIMGYDLCARDSISEKVEVLTKAVDQNALIVFEHDPSISAALIERTPSGDFKISPGTTINTL